MFAKVPVAVGRRLCQHTEPPPVLCAIVEITPHNSYKENRPIQTRLSKSSKKAVVMYIFAPTEDCSSAVRYLLLFLQNMIRRDAEDIRQISTTMIRSHDGKDRFKYFSTMRNMAK